MYLTRSDSRKHVSVCMCAVEYYNASVYSLVASNGAYLIYKQLNHCELQSGDRKKNLPSTADSFKQRTMNAESKGLKWHGKKSGGSAHELTTYTVCKANVRKPTSDAASRNFVDVWDFWCPHHSTTDRKKEMSVEKTKSTQWTSFHPEPYARRRRHHKYMLRHKSQSHLNLNWQYLHLRCMI